VTAGNDPRAAAVASSMSTETEPKSCRTTGEHHGVDPSTVVPQSTPRRHSWSEFRDAGFLWLANEWMAKAGAALREEVER